MELSHFASSALIAALSSTITTSLLLFVGKLYFKALIEQHFDERRMSHEFKYAQQGKIADHLFEKRVGIYPELVELIHRLKVAMVRGREARRIYEWDDNFKEMCALLSENLFQWRYYLPKDIFTALHDFKHACQEVSLFVDICSRDDNFENQTLYEQQMDFVAPAINRGVTLHETLQSMINSKMQSLGVPDVQ